MQCPIYVGFLLEKVLKLILHYCFGLLPDMYHHDMKFAIASNCVVEEGLHGLVYIKDKCNDDYWLPLKTKKKMMVPLI